MKKIILCILFLFSFITAQGYDVPVCITLNGDYINMEVAPYLENGVTYVPLRFLSDVFDADEVKWNDITKEATVNYKERTIVVMENSDIAKVDDTETKMNGIAKITGGRLFVPLRFFAEAFGLQVNWNQKYYRVEITSNEVKLPPELTDNKGYDDDHLFWLARIIHSESQGESLEGKIGVGNVIINRVLSDDFPDTIYKVIFDTKYGVQFQPVINGSIYNEPGGQSYMAAKLVLEGENTAGDSLYFLNPKIATSFWIVNNRPFYTTIGNHDFYL